MSFKSVLICYLERKKVVKIPEKKTTSDYDFLSEMFRMEFGFESNISVVFQRFDEDWNTNIDLDTESLLNDRDKLNAIIVPSPTTLNKIEKVEGSRISDGSSELNFADDNRDRGISKKRKIHSDDDANSSSPLCLNADLSVDCSEEAEHGDVSSRTPSHKRVKVEKSEDDKIPLPDPFPLPSHHSHDIEVALKKKKISPTEKQRFISDIASAMLCYKRYPNHDDYLCVARTVIIKYPFLKSSDSRPYDALVRSLVNRFKEFRRPKKPRVSSSGSGSGVCKPPQKSPGLTNVIKMPKIPPGEDLTSYERNNKVLQIEFKKTKRNNTVINDLMQRTFAHRYSDIQGKSYHINDLFEKFPFLQETKHIIMDMERLIGVENLRATAASAWKSLTPKVLSQAKLEGVHKSRLHFLMNQYEISEEDNILAALTVLPLLLPDVRTKPSHESVIYYSQASVNVEAVAADNENVSPYVLVVGNVKNPRQTFLVVDKQIIADIDFDDIPLILMSAFFIFNICYPLGCTNFYSFMEVFTFNFSLNKASPTVKHLAASLKD